MFCATPFKKLFMKRYKTDLGVVFLHPTSINGMSHVSNVDGVIIGTVRKACGRWTATRAMVVIAEGRSTRRAAIEALQKASA